MAYLNPFCRKLYQIKQFFRASLKHAFLFPRCIYKAGDSPMISLHGQVSKNPRLEDEQAG